LIDHESQPAAPGHRGDSTWWQVTVPVIRSPGLAEISQDKRVPEFVRTSAQAPQVRMIAAPEMGGIGSVIASFSAGQLTVTGH